MEPCGGSPRSRSSAVSQWLLHTCSTATRCQNAGAAEVILDGDLGGARLASCIAGLAADAERRRGMAGAARTLARPDATARIADTVDSLLGERRVS